MKRILLSWILILTTGYIYAQSTRLLVDENFTNYTIGDLNNSTKSQGNWKPLFAGNGADFVQVADAYPLLFPDYTSGSQYINVFQKSDYLTGSWKYPDDPFKAFNNGAVTVGLDSTTLYISFLVRVPTGAKMSTEKNATPNLALRNLNGSTFAHFYISSSGNGEGVKFGINKDGSESAVYASSVFELNTTYLIVLRYDVANGDAADYDDKMYMWVNPSLSVQPPVSSAQVAIDNFWDFKFDGGFNTAAQSLELFQETNSATASFDAFKVAYAQGFTTAIANAAAAWATLSPAGVPLPVKPGKILGYEKDRSIKIEWNSNSEYNVAHYEIEHSVDGINFFYAGKVMAKKGKGELWYDWLDAFPSKGNNYYRIKNVYSSENFIYSKVVRIVIKDQAILFSLYPNPVSGKNISIAATNLTAGDCKIEIFNSAGQQVYVQRLMHAGGTLIQSVTLPAVLLKGIYNIQLAGSDYRFAKSFLVQ